MTTQSYVVLRDPEAMLKRVLQQAEFLDKMNRRLYFEFYARHLAAKRENTFWRSLRRALRIKVKPIPKITPEEAEADYRGRDFWSWSAPEPDYSHSSFGYPAHWGGALSTVRRLLRNWSLGNTANVTQNIEPSQVLSSSADILLSSSDAAELASISYHFNLVEAQAKKL